MRYLKMILLCAVIAALAVNPMFTRAEVAGAANSAVSFRPLSFDPSTYFPDDSAPAARLAIAPAATSATPGAATQPADEDGRVTRGDLADDPIYACACGCGVFDVGTRSMLPMGTGLTVYFEYDYQDQNINWDGSNRAPAANNPDKEIRTNFFSLGLQYFFDRNWGIQAEFPFDDRYFKTTGGATGNDIVATHWDTIGDIRVEGIYDGFFPDQSAGVLFGLKLPTGNFTHNNAFGDIDRDTEIGTGSTDVLLGGFYRNNLSADGKFSYFAQLNTDLPFLIQDQYRPGFEIDGAAGVYMNGLHLGPVGITPIAQVIDSLRSTDSGTNSAHPVQSGYERVLLSPGIEFDLHPVMVYADVEIPVYEHTTGNQLIAGTLFKMIVSYHF
jgi:hypothetical protein